MKIAVGTAVCRHHCINTFSDPAKYKPRTYVPIGKLFDEVCEILLLLFVFELVKFINNKYGSIFTFANNLCHTDCVINILGFGYRPFMCALFGSGIESPS